MKAKLLHNPTAGIEKYTTGELVSLIQSEGISCKYSSMKKKNWHEIEQGADFIIIAGGDGTVREVAEILLQSERSDKKIPLALLPMGTANNFAETLGITGEAREIIRTWKHKNRRKVDIGRIHNLPETAFFIEGFGFGVIPRLMEKMEKKKKTDKQETRTPGKKMKTALQTLHDIILSYQARNCRIEADGILRSGKFLLVEIMNTRLIGPNLCLAPLADPSDGELEVVLVPESKREKFAFDVLHKNSLEETFDMEVFKAKNIKIWWEGTDVHADDEIIRLNQAQEVSVELREHALELFVPYV